MSSKKIVTEKSRSRGRPKIQIEKKKFETLCSIMCTEEEIAQVFCCSIDTINNWCKKEYNMNFSDIYKKRIAKGKASLRRAQFAMAEHNPTMNIWLSKQYLGQKDNTDIQTQIAFNVEYDALSQSLIDEAKQMQNEKKQATADKIENRNDEA